jgi:hypothetical protein
VGEDEYSTNTVYTYMWMEKWWYLLKLFQEWGGTKENGRRGKFKYDIVNLL